MTSHAHTVYMHVLSVRTQTTFNYFQCSFLRWCRSRRHVDHGPRQPHLRRQKQPSLGLQLHQQKSAQQLPRVYICFLFWHGTCVGVLDLTHYRYFHPRVDECPANPCSQSGGAEACPHQLRHDYQVREGCMARTPLSSHFHLGLWSANE